MLTEAPAGPREASQRPCLQGVSPTTEERSGLSSGTRSEWAALAGGGCTAEALALAKSHPTVWKEPG